MVKISQGATAVCAIDDEANLWCWGYGRLGLLGQGDTLDIGSERSPRDVGPVPLDGGVRDVSVGFENVCVAMLDGRVRCWGRHSGGVLGLPWDASDRDAPEPIIGDSELVTSIAALDFGEAIVQISTNGGGRNSFRWGHACAVAESGNAYCWGSDATGVLGYGDKLGFNAQGCRNGRLGDDEPVNAFGPLPFGQKVLQIAADRYASCALLEGGVVRCWGTNFESLPLGIGFTNPDDAPDEVCVREDHTVEVDVSKVPDIRLSGSAVAISMWGSGSMRGALLDNGAVQVWGWSVEGLGPDRSTKVGDDEHPADVGVVYYVGDEP